MSLQRSLQRLAAPLRQSANDREGHKIPNVSGNDEKLKVFNCVLHECEIIVLRVQNNGSLQNMLQRRHFLVNTGLVAQLTLPGLVLFVIFNI